MVCLERKNLSTAMEGYRVVLISSFLKGSHVCRLQQKQQSLGLSQANHLLSHKVLCPTKAAVLTSCICPLHVTHSFCSGRSDHKCFHHPGTCQHAESGQQASHPTAKVQPASSQHREHGKLCQRGADPVSGAASEGKGTKQKELARDELASHMCGVCERDIHPSSQSGEQPQQMASPW